MEQPAGGSELSPTFAARLLLQDLYDLDLAAAAERFHYPPDYSTEERLADVVSVRNSLEILLSHFGAIRDLEEVPRVRLIAHVGVGGGTGQYWQRCEAQMLVPFRVHFERVPEGMALVRFCRFDDGWKLQALHVGGPPSKHGVQVALAGAGREMAALLLE